MKRKMGLISVSVTQGNREQGMKLIQRSRTGLLILGFSSLLASCTGSPTAPKVSLQVKPVDPTGTYLVQGTANLPDRSRIRVQSLRLLQSSQQSSPNYGVLDWQLVQVHQGQWQARLHLWQVNPEGRYQEAWQLQQNQLGLTWQPAEGVLFLATVEPGFQEDGLKATISQLLSTSASPGTHPNTQFTTTGDRFLPASQLLPLALPTGQTMPPISESPGLDQVWGNEAAVPPTPSAQPTQPALPPVQMTLSNAPLRPEQMLR